MTNGLLRYEESDNRTINHRVNDPPKETKIIILLEDTAGTLFGKQHLFQPRTFWLLMAECRSGFGRHENMLDKHVLCPMIGFQAHATQ